jgi:hypothetical protein
MFAYAFFLSIPFTQYYSRSTSSIIGPASHGFKFNSILKEYSEDLSTMPLGGSRKL